MLFILSLGIVVAIVVNTGMIDLGFKIPHSLNPKIERESP
jgi:uncharacterized ion transporter superfamily protein YfcC